MVEMKVFNNVVEKQNPQKKFHSMYNDILRLLGFMITFKKLKLSKHKLFKFMLHKVCVFETKMFLKIKMENTTWLDGGLFNHNIEVPRKPR